MKLRKLKTRADGPSLTNPTIAACICTRNRPDELERALLSLRASSYTISEVIVADDSTDERTAHLLERSFPEVRYVSGPRTGLGANRNTALHEADTDYLFFLDDDATLDSEFVALCVNALGKSSNPLRTIVTGTELNHGEQVFPHEQSFLGFQNIDYRPGDEFKTVVINSTLFPVQVFETVEFDRRLVYGYDEVDVTTQAVAAGYEIVFCPNACNQHFPSTVNREYYHPHTDSSRIYVTFKRYLRTDKRPLKACTFLVVALAHTYAASFRRKGLAGLISASAISWRALKSIKSI